MSKAARRLGRGLDSMVSVITKPSTLDTPLVAEPSSPQFPSEARGLVFHPQALSTPTNALNPNPFQPRHSIASDTVLSLAESIRKNGFLQPILARNRGGQLEIIAGERRWTAAKSLGLSEVPVIIRDASDEQMLELALIENLQREDLNAIDRAGAYREFCARFGLRPDQVAERLGEDRTTVLNYLRLLELPEPIRALIAARTLSMGHARCLLGVTDERRRMQLAEAAAAHELSVRALEEIVRREKTRQEEGGAEKAPAVRSTSPHLEDLQRRFEQAVKTKVRIQEGKRKGSGRIIIEYYTLDDFDRIVEQLGVATE